LGEVLTNLDLTPDAPTEHCGTCTRCIDACPTDAIQPFVVDANRCIAYHTIENRAEMPDASFPRLGCRLRYLPRCLPLEPAFAKKLMWLTFSLPWNVAPKLTELAEISDEEWGKRFPASALRRIKPEMLRRNARNLQVLREKNDQKSFCLILMAQCDTLDAIVSITNRLAVEFGYKQTTQEEIAQIQNLNSKQIIKQSGISIFKLPFCLEK